MKGKTILIVEDDPKFDNERKSNETMRGMKS